MARLKTTEDWAELGWGVALYCTVLYCIVLYCTVGVSLLLPGLALVTLTLTVYAHNSVVCPDLFKQYDWVFCYNDTDLLQE